MKTKCLTQAHVVFYPRRPRSFCWSARPKGMGCLAHYGDKPTSGRWSGCSAMSWRRSLTGPGGLCPGTAAGALCPPRKIGCGPGIDNLVFPGDFDGDGISDLVARTPNGTLMPCSDNGSEGSSSPVGSLPDGTPSAACSAPGLQKVTASPTSNATNLQWAVVPLPRQRIGWILATSTHRSGMEGVLHHHQLLGLQW
jgi:hypothetical protein